MPTALHSETSAQRTALRELAALSTIPVVWAGKEPSAIAAGLADVLIRSLYLDFAFVRMCDPKGGAAIEMTRGRAWETFPTWLRTHLGDAGHFSRQEIVTDLGGGEACRGLVIPIGVNGESGLVAAACTRTDFPNEIDQLLLSVAVNHAATAFQNARLREELDAKMAELSQARNELEIKVADRTAKLTTANEELSKQKEQLDGLFELSPDAVILVDHDFHVSRVNKEFTRMFGYTAEEVVGQWLPELIMPEELRAEGLRNWDRLISGDRVELETIRQRKDGARFDVSVVARGISLGSSQVAVYLIYRDITEQKKAERNLRRSEATLLEGQRLVHMGSWTHDPSGTATVSPEMKRIYDIESDQETCRADLFIERIHPEDRLVVEEIVRRAQLDKTGYDVSYRIVLPDASIKHIYSVGHPVLNQSGELLEYIGTSMDVTEQRKAKAELEKAFEEIKQRTEAARRSERELRDMVDTVPAHVWRTSPEGQVDFVNDRWLQFTGLASEEAFGWKWEAVVHPDDRTRVGGDWRTAIRNGQAMETEARVRRADGEYCWWFIRNVPLRDETGKLVKWYGTAIDIDDRKRAEQALRKSEERWRSVFENSAIGVALTDLNGRFLVTNHVYQTMVGYTEEELRALSFLDLTHEDYREANWALATELLEGKRRQFQIEKKYLRKDGSSIWVSNNVSLVPGTESEPRFIMALSEDITQRKSAEVALRRSEAYLAEGQRLAKMGSWAVNPKTETCIYWSEEMRQIFGLDPERSNLPDREEFLRLVHPEDRAGFNERVDQALRAKADIVQDYRIVLPDGTIKHIHAIGHPVLDETGNLIEYVGTDVDVTERKLAEEALRRSEGYLAEAQRLSHAGSWAVQFPDRKIIYWSKELYRIFGLEPGPTPPSHLEATQRMHAEDVPRIDAVVDQAFRNRTDFEIDYRLFPPNGTTKYIHAIGHPVVNASGDVTEFLGTAMDVTERKQAEEKLRRSEADLLEAQRISHTGSWKHDVSSGTVTVSPEVFRIFGVKPDEDSSTTEFWLSRNHPEDQKRIRELFKRSEIEKTDYEADYRIVLPDGSIKHIHAVGHPVLTESGELVEFVGTAMDITERKQAEDKIREQEIELRQILDAAPQHLSVLRGDGSHLYINQSSLDFLGLKLEEWQKRDIRELVHPDDAERVARERKQALSSGSPLEIEMRMRRYDGEYRWFFLHYKPLKDYLGRITRWVVPALDIDERKQSEEALRRSEAYLAEAQRLTHTGSWAWNVRTDALFWSQEIFRIYDCNPEMMPTWDFLLERVHPDDRPEIERRKKMESTQKGWADSGIDFRIVLPDATIKHLHSIAHPVMDKLGEITEVVGTIVDVTERKHAEEERERLRQLEADLSHKNRVTMLGELASSLAHELNQPIAAAITSANACLRWLAHTPPDVERASAAAMRIENDGSRAAAIIQRLRAFYKTGAPPQRELVDVNEIAVEILTLLRNEAGRHSISLRTELAPQLPQVMADRVQLQQVLMNLMLNGIEAIRDGAGELTIRSQSTEDGLLLISVIDTGVGFPSEDLDRIFNAFYSTKPQGTGMGLAISRSIIEAHGGRLWATANAERGATFRFTLPAEGQQ